MEENIKNVQTPKPYTYTIVNLSTGLRYHGDRARNVKLGLTAEQDIKYMGSCKNSPFDKDSIKNNPADYKKEIVQEYDKEDEMWKAEFEHNKSVMTDPEWANKAAYPYIPATEEVKRKWSISRTGRRQTDETKEKLRIAHTGKIFSEEHRQNIREAWKHRPPMSEETRKKISMSNTGKKISEERKLKLREVNKGKKHYHDGTKSFFLLQDDKRIIEMNLILGMREVRFGRIMSQETKKKISEATLGKHITEETRLKMSKSRMGRITTQETRRKLSQSNTGKKHSEETKRKLSEALKRRKPEINSRGQETRAITIAQKHGFKNHDAARECFLNLRAKGFSGRGISKLLNVPHRYIYNRLKNTGTFDKERV